MSAARKTPQPPELFIFHWGTQKNYPFKEQFVIGRTEGDFKFEQDLMMSAQHCRITMTKEGILCEDLGSEHGTWVNDELLEQGERAILTAGARVIVGRQTFSLIIKTGLEEEEPKNKWKRRKTEVKEEEPPAGFFTFFRRKPNDIRIEYDKSNSRSATWTGRLILIAATAAITHQIDKNGLPTNLNLAAWINGTSAPRVSRGGTYNDLLHERNRITTDCYHLVEDIRAGKTPASEAIFAIDQRHVPDLHKLREKAATFAKGSDAFAAKARTLAQVAELQERKLKVLSVYLGQHGKDELNEMVRLEKEIAVLEPTLTAE